MPPLSHLSFNLALARIAPLGYAKTVEWNPSNLPPVLLISDGSPVRPLGEERSGSAVKHQGSLLWRCELTAKQRAIQAKNLRYRERKRAERALLALMEES